MKNNEVILHGECMVFVSKLPLNVTKLEKQPYMIVAPSETTGNHHVVDGGDGVNFFKSEGGVIFMENEKPTQIRCVMAERHHVKTIPPGTYEFGSQMEYDPFSARLQKVRD